MGLPRRSIPRARDVLPSLATGLGIGLLFGLPAVGVMRLFEVDWADVLGMGLMVAVVTGVPVGLGRWLSAPVEETAASSPESVLRGDRTALLIAAGAVGMCTFAASFVIFWQMDSSGLGNLFGGALLGSGTAVIVLFGSGASWLSYTVARLWLALWGRLPWRLTPFLRHAHAVGVLRQAGPAYQIRHDLLRSYLADRRPPTARRHFRVVTATNQDGTEPHATTPRRRRWRIVAGAAVALTMLPATIAFVESDTQPWVTLPHSGTVIALAFHPDGSMLTTASYRSDNYSDDFWNLTQWHLPGGARTAHRTVSVGEEFYEAALSSYGTLVTGGSYGTLGTGDDTVRLWDAAGGPAVFLRSPPDLCGPNFPRSDSTITSVSISADGRSVVTAGVQGVQLWPVATGGEPITITCNAGYIGNVAVSPDGTKVAANVDDGTVRMWDVATGAAMTFPGLGNYVEDLAFSANGAVLAVSSNGMVQIWQVAGGVPLRPITTGGYSLLALTPDGDTVATYGAGGVLRLWDVTTGRHTASLPHRAGYLNPPCLQPRREHPRHCRRERSATVARPGADGRAKLG